jgi:hypothetical protein
LSGSVNPFGAGASACLGVARAFRVVFRSQLRHQPAAEEHEEACLSLLDLHPSSAAPLNPDWAGVDLGDSFLVGLGAIGNGAVWALRRAPDLRGILHLVDAEAVDGSNPQRYVLTSLADIRKLKVDLAAEHLAGTTIDAKTHPQTWGQFLAGRGDWQLPRVASRSTRRRPGSRSRPRSRSGW